MGDRAATLLLFLTSPLEGGATVFPLLGLAVPPVAGSALLWQVSHTLFNTTLP